MATPTPCISRSRVYKIASILELPTVASVAAEPLGACDFNDLVVGHSRQEQHPDNELRTQHEANLLLQAPQPEHPTPEKPICEVLMRVLPSRVLDHTVFHNLEGTQRTVVADCITLLSALGNTLRS